MLQNIINKIYMRMGFFHALVVLFWEKMAHGQFRIFKSIQKVNVCQYYSIVCIDKLFYSYHTGICNLLSTFPSLGALTCIAFAMIVRKRNSFSSHAGTFFLCICTAALLCNQPTFEPPPPVLSKDLRELLYIN